MNEARAAAWLTGLLEGEGTFSLNRQSAEIAYPVLKVEMCDEGIVARVTKFGFFVELKDFFVQGLIQLEDLKDDYYLFDDKRHRLRGRKSGKVFKIGTEVKITVAKVDIMERRVIFNLSR